MNYQIHPHQLEFLFPFKIAHTTRTHTDGAYLMVESNGHFGKGEVVFPPYYSENLSSFQNFMVQVELPNEMNFAVLANFLENIERKIPGNYFAKAALDIALHNLCANLERKSIAEHYQITGKAKTTSYTLGISSNEEMIQKLEFGKDFTYIKLKVDEKEMERIIQTYRKHSDKPFVVDANQGFQNREKALEWCQELHKIGVAYMEQPFHKEDLKNHEWLKERSPIPIIADESFQTLSDYEKVKNAFHGVNVKLMKCGGIYPAYQSLVKAKDLKLQTVIGCMSESNIAVDAAAHLSPMATWADLDGPHLLKKK